MSATALPIENIVVSQNDLYKSLLNDRKILRRDSFSLADGTGAKRDWKLSDLDLTHCKGSEGALITEQSVHKLTKYRIRLVFGSISSQPVCRFDSDGRYHENPTHGIPLKKRKISTPHFHQYDDNGIEIAFKTHKLINFEDDIKNNVNVGMDEMCNVFNILPPLGSSLTYARQSPLFPVTVIEDTHKDVTFPV